MRLDPAKLIFRRTLTVLQIDQLMAFYDREWWTQGRTRSDVERALKSSLVFALIDPSNEDLAGFARVVTDYAYKALIFDVIVAPDWRGSGLGKLLMDTVLDDPALARVKHRELYCAEDMMPFYRRWGFTDDLPGFHFMRKVE